MSSISPNPNPNPNLNPNPNPETFKIEGNRKPNWLELPEDVWFMILSKLKTTDLIEIVEKVCLLFGKICKQPATFKIIDMYRPPQAYMDFDVNLMTRLAVDRSAGGLVDITLQTACDCYTLMYIVDRSKNLKRLVLPEFNCLFDICLIEAVEKLPMLMELQLIGFKFSDNIVEGVGRACPSLKSFSLHQVGFRHPNFVEYDNDVTIVIARSMPQLRYLQLIGNYMSDEGLKAILDGCPLLESLDLRACFHLNLSGDLSKRCEKIKRVRYPNDSTVIKPGVFSYRDYTNWKAREEAEYDDWNAQQDE